MTQSTNLAGKLSALAFGLLFSLSLTQAGSLDFNPANYTYEIGSLGNLNTLTAGQRTSAVNTINSLKSNLTSKQDYLISYIQGQLRDVSEKLNNDDYEDYFPQLKSAATQLSNASTSINNAAIALHHRLNQQKQAIECGGHLGLDQSATTALNAFLCKGNSVQDASKVLQTAGYPVSHTWTALKASFHLAGHTAVQKINYLFQGGYPTDQVIYTIWRDSSYRPDLVNCLKDRQGYNVKQIEILLRYVGALPAEVIALLDRTIQNQDFTTAQEVSTHRTLQFLPGTTFASPGTAGITLKTLPFPVGGESSFTEKLITEVTLSGTEGIAKLPAHAHTLTLNDNQTLDLQENVTSTEPTETVGESEISVGEALQTFLPGSNVDTLQKVQLSKTSSDADVITIKNNSLELVFQDDTTIYASEDWNGVLAPPRDVKGDTVRSGFVTSAAVDVGPNTVTTLLLSKPAKVVVPAATGDPYYSINGTVWARITTQCADGDAITPPTTLLFPGECYLKTADQTIIWTYHFTKFATMLEGTFEAPTISLLESDDNTVKANQNFTITWTDEDPDSDASIYLYYDTDQTGADGLPINLVAISEDAETDSYEWDTSELAEGDYYLYAVISDSLNEPVVSYSSKLVTIKHNNAPDITSTPVSLVKEDTLYEYTVTATDLENDPLTYSLAEAPEQMTLDSTTGLINYTPTQDDVGSHVIIITVTDDKLTTNQSFVLTVREVNDAPTATDDTYSIPEDNTLTIELPGVLSNDTDPEEDELVVNLATDVTNGVLTLNTNGSFTYTPNENFNGEDSFTYKVNDGEYDSNLATATITITPVNDQPVLIVPGQQELKEGETVEFSISATDIDQDTLTLTIASHNLPVEPTFTTNDAGTANFVWAAGFEDAGTYTLTFRTTDSNNTSDEQTVSIVVGNVNRPPVAVTDVYTINEDATLAISASGVLANDTDADNNSLTAIPVINPLNGTLTLNLDGSFTYTPRENFNGEDSFTYKVNDGEDDSNLVAVTITVDPVNDSPQTTDQTLSTPEDNSIDIVLAASDIDNDPLTFLITENPSNGILTGTAPNLTYTPNENYNGTDAFTFTVDDGNGGSAVGTVSITITPVNDNPELSLPEQQEIEETETLNFSLSATDVDEDSIALSISTHNLPLEPTFTDNQTGTANFSWLTTYEDAGSYTVTFKAVDGNEGESEQTVSIVVGNVNRPPVAVADSYITDEDEIFTINAPGVLANDTDADKDTLTASLIEDVQHGNLTLNSAGSLTYTPAENFNGEDSFSYKVSDGESDSEIITVTFTVNPINDQPITSDQELVTNEDLPLNIVLTATDIDSYPLTFLITENPSNGILTGAAPNLTYTPNENYNGTDAFTFTVDDGNGGSAVGTVSITITPVNDNPELSLPEQQEIEETETLNFSLSATDVDEDSIALSISTHNLPLEPTFTDNQTGTANFSWLTTYEDAGSYTVTFKAVDGNEGESEQTVSIVVGNVNRPPVAVADSYITDEDEIFTINAPGVLANDTDADRDPLTANLIEDVQHGNLTLNSAGSLTYTPAENFNGEDSFTYKVNDGEDDSNLATVTIVITPVNDQPQSEQQTITLDEDTPTEITLSASDIDNDPLIFSIVDNPQHGVLNGVLSNLTYTPNENYNGEDSFTFKVNDGELDSEVVAVSLTINPVNDAPKLELSNPICNLETCNISWLDADPDNDAQISLYYHTDQGAQNGTLIAENISEDSETDSATWDITAVPSGKYYISASITDNLAEPVINHYQHQVSVKHPFDVVKPITIKKRKVKKKETEVHLDLFMQNNTEHEIKDLAVTITSESPYVNFQGKKEEYTGKIKKFESQLTEKVKGEFKFELAADTPLAEQIIFQVESRGTAICDKKSKKPCEIEIISQDSFVFE